MLDTKTIIVMGFVFQVISILAFAYYLFAYGFKNRLLVIYTIGRFFFFLLAAIYLFVPDLTPLVMSITAVLAFSSLILESYCIIYINKKESNKKLFNYLAYAITFSLIYSVFSTDITIRVMIASLFYVFSFSYIFYSLTIAKGNTKIQKFVGIITLLFVLVNINRGASTVFGGNPITILSEYSANQMWMIVLLLMTFIFPTCFLFIKTEKDNETLQNINATKDKFFKIIAHDLKEPISQMIMLSGLIETNYKDFGEEKTLTFIKAMNESSKRGFNLLENLLNWSRSQTNTIEYNPVSFEFKNVVIETRKLLQKKADNKAIKINCEGVSEGEILGDKNMLHTVVRNLLSNAIKFTDKGGEIVISNEFVNGIMKFSIADNGVGMSKEVAENIFKIDSKHVGIGTNNERGTGIGLILCKEFILKHKGDIWVKSKEGEGSKFRFNIPIS